MIEELLRTARPGYFRISVDANAILRNLGVAKSDTASQQTKNKWLAVSFNEIVVMCKVCQLPFVLEKVFIGFSVLNKFVDPNLCSL